MIHADLTNHRFHNILQSIVLLAAMAGLLGLLGWSIAGLEGLVWALLLGVLVLTLGPTASPQWVLRMYRAQPIAFQQAPDLYNLLQRLAQRAGMAQTPGLYYIPSRVLNAFTVGHRGKAAIAVSDGLLRVMNGRELAGVLAHELSHLRHHDTWVMGLADAVSRLTALLAQAGLLLLIVSLPLAALNGMTLSPWVLLLLLLAPSLSALLQLALSRTREYDADLGAVELTGDPRGLASALAKLERYQSSWWERIFAPGRREPDPALLRTHPATEERIRRLLALIPARSNLLPYRVRPPENGLEVLASLPKVTRPPRWHWSGLWH